MSQFQSTLSATSQKLNFLMRMKCCPLSISLRVTLTQQSKDPSCLVSKMSPTKESAALYLCQLTDRSSSILLKVAKPRSNSLWLRPMRSFMTFWYQKWRQPNKLIMQHGKGALRKKFSPTVSLILPTLISSQIKRVQIFQWALSGHITFCLDRIQPWQLFPKTFLVSYWAPHSHSNSG